MKHIPSEAVQNIHNQNSFFQFLKDHLGWKIQDDVSFENLTYDYFPEDIGIKPADLHGSRLSQLRPFTNDQPWGIFFIHLAKPQVYVTQLRKLIRALAPMKRKHKDYPTWNPQHLLFICTPNWKNYTFAHFEGEKPESAKLSIFGWECGSDFIRTLCEFNLKALQMPEADMFSIPPKTWLEEWSKAFDVKVVTDKFYEELRDTFKNIQQYIHGISSEKSRSFAQLIINRLLFLKFLERKGWLFVEEEDTIEQRRAYLKRQRDKIGKQNQWQYFFSHLFFNGLNRFSIPGKSEYTDTFYKIIGHVPYLNGGLFEKSEVEKGHDIKIDNELWDEIFDRLLDRYNFTIQENTPLDIEVALNPDLLGYAYEELIAERHGQGAFYTHPTEVGLMCRETLKTYLEEHTTIEHAAIAQLVDNWNATSLTEDEAFSVYRLLLNIKILDPAVGSAAYPVRMMQELVNIHQALAKRMTEGQFRYIFENKLANPRSIFDLKLNIIQNNLYGVDIDYFAVEIAKLRFWLSLVVDYKKSDGKEIDNVADLKHIPALPNLDFKLRVGDSLVASAGVGKKGLVGEKGKAFNLDILLSKHTPEMFIQDIIPELRKLKEQFFNFEEMRKEDPKFYTISKDDLRKKIEEKENEISKALGFVKVENIDSLPHILWQIHFAEIFTDQRFGFDICIANPPYLRQEKINELFKTFKVGLTKDDLVETYEELYKDQKLKIDKKSDLYVYFYMRGTNLLKEKGVLCFICSNSWLDVGYGAKLQEFLLRNTRIKAVYDNSAKRSFEKADVNTTINVFVKDSSVEKRTVISTSAGSKVEVASENVVRFVTFRKPFELAAGSDTLQEIERAIAITSTDDYRVYPIKQKDLWQAGLETKEEGHSDPARRAGEESDSETLRSAQGDKRSEYAGDKWGGKYLRAPDIFYILQDCVSSGKIVSLEPHVAEVITVSWGRLGRNVEIFLIKPEKPSKKQHSGAVLKSPREVNKIIFKKDDTKYLLLIDEEIRDKLVEAPILWVDIRGDKHLCLLNADNVYFTHNFHGIVPFEKYDPWLIAALLSSTMVWLVVEVVGRRGLGGGAVRILVKDLKKTSLLLAPELLSRRSTIILKGIFEKEIGKRQIHDAFTECGLSSEKSIRSQQPNPLPDRKALDDVVFDALGLTEVERKEVYWAVCELVQNRLRKAKSV